MANRHMPVGAVGLLSVLAAAVGCQSSSHPAAVVDAYPQPRFDAPVTASATPAPPLPPVAPAPTPTPAAKPPTRVALAAQKLKVAKAVTYDVLNGIPVQAGWVPPVAPRPWRWIVVHHSDTEHGDAAYIDKLHKANGWDGLGYDFVIGNGTDSSGDGNVEVGYRWRQQSIGAHAKTPDNRFNEYGIGICLVGDMMRHPPTPKQIAAVERLSAFLMRTYHIAPDHILGHGDTKATDCPGTYTDMDAIRYGAAKLAGPRLVADAARPRAGAELMGNVAGVR